MRAGGQTARKYALAVLAAIAALLLRKLLNPFYGIENPYHTAWAAVAFSAWYCGIGPAIVTLLISLVGVEYWFLPPFGSFALESRSEIFGMLGFLAFSALIVFFGEAARRNAIRRQHAEQQLRIAHEQLEYGIRERTAELERSAAALEKKTAEALEQANMLDLANDAIFVRSVADKISYWNKGAERLYGWTKEEALGRSPHDLLHTEFSVPLSKIKGSNTWEGELRHTKRDGTQIILASRWTALRDSNHNATGWLEINTDVTNRKRAEDAARSLSGRLLTMQDEERRRIARELHDSLGQYLAALKMLFEGFLWQRGEQLPIASECTSILEKCIAETRTVSYLLHPPLLDESGLGSAVRLYVDEFSRRSGIAVSFEVSPDRLRLDSELEIALFRAVQEALTNVHRHSGASSVEIRLTMDSDHIRLEIHDNGRGVAQERLDGLLEGAIGTGVGLAGMRERFRELGGTLQLLSADVGTTLIVTTPLLARVAVG